MDLHCWLPHAARSCRNRSTTLQNIQVLSLQRTQPAATTSHAEALQKPSAYTCTLLHVRTPMRASALGLSAPTTTLLQCAPSHACACSTQLSLTRPPLRPARPRARRLAGQSRRRP